MPAALGVERSFGGQRWTFADVGEEAVHALAHATNVSPVVARLLAGRGLSAATADEYLNPTLKGLLPEPLRLKDMDKAVARVHHAVERGERIAIFGDYDVDGSCSAALLSDFLTAIGRTPTIYIPDRLTEGYGPSPAALRRLRQSGIGLVITADCGATADAALGAARDAGLDVIVLDHHAIERADTAACAHVNPNRPDDTSEQTHLCAAGVVFLFLVALNRHLRETGYYRAHTIAEPDLRASVDLVGLATICDVVPLVGVNRAFVRSALARIAAMPRPGLKALAELARIGEPFTPYHFGFVFGPRINAGGRVGRCSLGAELLTATTEVEAMPLAAQLDRHNRERQVLEAIILEEATAEAATQDNSPFLLVSGQGWHSGVVGIVAGRLKDRFGKPALVVGFDGEVGRGSARSIAGVDIGAVVREARDLALIENGGGHPMAAGFSLSRPKLEPFRDFLIHRFSAFGSALAAANELELEGIFSAAGATPALIADIGRAGPFGAGNPEPVLAAADLRVAYADIVGQGHLRMRLEGNDGAGIGAIAFRAGGTPLGAGLLRSRGALIHAAGTLKLDRWNGSARVQLEVRDAAPAGV